MVNVKEKILEEKIIAIIRLGNGDQAHAAAHALSNAGMKLIEITLNTPGALALITTLSAELPNCVIGAGTVLSGDDARKAVEAGARFLVSPIAPEEMIHIGKKSGAITIAGGLTPSEIYNAHKMGADFIKPFPLAGIGPQYIRALKGPFPEIEFIPTNGVTMENMLEFFDAGVAAVGLGSVLVSNNDDVAAIEERATRALALIGSRTNVGA
jgi:2-dehydro-3-deoxyphosphogluconate aldolase / (4S)-4-hydroxy-2-oxoglutarate aldolase